MFLSTITPHLAVSRNTIMPAIILVTSCSYLMEYCFAINCFKCTVTEEKYHSYTKNTTVVTPMCSKFDKSNVYITDCQYSTMCLKTISTLHLQNGEGQEAFTRGCAQQKDTTQVFRNRQWQQEHSVQEVYEEGCTELKTNNLAGTVITQCYCRGNLCNSSKKIRVSYVWTSLNVLIVIFFFQLFCF